MRYRIVKRFSPQRFGELWLAIAGVVGSAILISVVFHIATANIIVVPGLFLAVRRYMLSSTALTVARAGVQVGDVGVPWESVAQLVVLGPVPNGEVRVGVRLRPGAPLPPGVTPSIHPGDPQVQGLVRAEKLDVHRLRAKVRGFAPQVQVTEQQGQSDGVRGAFPPAGTP